MNVKSYFDIPKIFTVKYFDSNFKYNEIFVFVMPKFLVKCIKLNCNIIMPHAI